MFASLECVFGHKDRGAHKSFVTCFLVVSRVVGVRSSLDFIFGSGRAARKFASLVATVAVVSYRVLILVLAVDASALRINLNIDGTPIVSRSHTHPSHTQTSLL